MNSERPTSERSTSERSTSPTLQLAVGTGGFAVCFAIFGSVSAMMPILRARLHLSPAQTGIAVAAPVLVGSLGRIPLGMLSDRLGARRVFLAVLAASALAILVVPTATSFTALIVAGVFAGISLASFSVGVGLVSGWYPKEKQGTALGVYGAGNAGQSLAAWGAPLVASLLGFAWAFRVFALLAVAWLVVLAIFARDARAAAPPKTIRDVVRPLEDKRSWILSLYYFLTFGGFVAMAVYLPLLLTDTFGLAPADAGLRTAGFVVVATAARPIGGILADRVGGARILACVFPAVAVAAALLCASSMAPFTAGAIGMAAAIGLGNGAVFKLVPEQFPRSVGVVTGVVGAAGGLGGFFPPLLLGAVRQLASSFVPGFVALGGFALACLAVLFATTRPSGGLQTKLDVNA